MPPSNPTLCSRCGASLKACFVYPNAECYGYLVIHVAAGIFNVHLAAIYLPALNFVAEEMANADGHILGIAMHYSTLIAFVWALTGHIQGVASPFVGTIIDFTRYRRCTGWVMSMLCAVSLVLSGFVFENSEVAFVLQLVNICLAFSFYEGMYLVRISYLPEMSPDIDVVSQLSSMAYALLYLGQIVYAALVLGIAFVFDWKGVTTVRVSAAISAPLCAVLFSIAFYLLKSRRAAQTIPPQWWVVREGEKAALLASAAAADAPVEAAAEPAGVPSVRAAADASATASAAAADGGREAEGESESAPEATAEASEERAPPCADDPSVCAVCKWGTLHTLRNSAELWKSFPCVGVFLVGYACTAPAVSSLLVLVSAWFVSKLKYSLTQVRRAPPAVCRRRRARGGRSLRMRRPRATPPL